MLLFAMLLAGQSPDRLPPANPLPPPGTVEAAVMVPVNALFAALASRDGATVPAFTRPEGGTTAAVEQPDGTHTIRHRSWSEFAAGLKSGPERYEERLTDVAIDIDGDIAMVWSPYLFLIDNKVHHCGVDHFDLVRDGGAWKILSITWSQRTTGCGG